ncbi:hypothetical protein FB45DRAFT_749508, partial [Roridomyces roridus]
GGYPPQGGYPPPGGHGYGAPPGPGGFAARPQGPPPGADPMLWQWFSAVDQDHSGHVSVAELETALANGDWTRFDTGTVQMLMNMFDTDRSGTIGFEEFAGLFKYIQQWQDVFRRADHSGDGTIDEHELGNALRQFGFNLNPQLVQLLMRKYGFRGAPPMPGHAAAPLQITFDVFIRACVAARQASEAFQRVDSDRDGWVQIDYVQFMDVVLRLP